MKRILGAAVIATAVFSLAACGSDDNDSSSGGAPAGGDYCDLVQRYNEDSSTLDTVAMDDADQVKEGMLQMKSMMQDLQSQAPAEIKDDIDTVVGGFLAFIAVLEQNDFDMTKAMTDPDFVAVGSELDSDEFNAATDRLDEYERTVCGITES